MKAKANDLSGFSFRFAGSGHYKVTYTNPVRGDYYVATINDTGIIDATYNSDWAKAKDIQHLHYLVKLHGVHYSRNGKKIS